jgi:flagellar protein FliS
MIPQRKYVEAKVRTASPQELMLMLFDGAIQFADKAKSKLGAKDYAASCELLIRSQKILLELIGALNQEDLGKDIQETLAGHYWFAHNRLVKANLDHESKWIDEALYLLAQIRDNWAKAISSGEEQALVRAAQPSEAKGLLEKGAVSSLNLQG